MGGIRNKLENKSELKTRLGKIGKRLLYCMSPSIWLNLEGWTESIDGDHKEEEGGGKDRNKERRKRKTGWKTEGSNLHTKATFTQEVYEKKLLYQKICIYVLCKCADRDQRKGVGSKNERST